MPMNQPSYSEITPEILALSELCQGNGGIDPTLYGKYEVKRGLEILVEKACWLA